MNSTTVDKLLYGVNTIINISTRKYLLFSAFYKVYLPVNSSVCLYTHTYMHMQTYTTVNMISHYLKYLNHWNWSLLVTTKFHKREVLHLKCFTKGNLFLKILSFCVLWPGYLYFASVDWILELQVALDGSEFMVYQQMLLLETRKALTHQSFE